MSDSSAEDCEKPAKRTTSRARRPRSERRSKEQVAAIVQDIARQMSKNEWTKTSTSQLCKKYDIGQTVAQGWAAEASRLVLCYSKDPEWLEGLRLELSGELRELTALAKKKNQLNAGVGAIKTHAELFGLIQPAALNIGIDLGALSMSLQRLYSGELSGEASLEELAAAFRKPELRQIVIDPIRAALPAAGDTAEDWRDQILGQLGGTEQEQRHAVLQLWDKIAENYGTVRGPLPDSD